MALCSLFVLTACGETGSSTYTVQFETFGGDAYEPVHVEAGGLVEEPMPPTNGSKYFNGWFADEEFQQEWDFETDRVTSNMTLYAQFITRYNVSYYYNGEVQVTRKVNDGDTAPQLDYITASLKVLNWYTEEEMVTPYDFSEPVHSDLSLYAHVQVVTEWKFPQDMNIGTGWNVYDDVGGGGGNVTALEDGMLVEFNDPSNWFTYLRSPELTIPNLQNYTKLTITYKNLSEQNNLKVYFYRTTDSAWDGKAENFQVLQTNMKESDEYATLTISIPETAVLKNNWNGTLYLLRFEVKQVGTDVNEVPAGTKFIIGSISLGK